MPLQLTEHAAAITEDVIAIDYAQRSKALARYGERGHDLYRRDNLSHLSFLAEAVRSGEAELFVDYAAWAKSMLAAHGVPIEHLIENFRLLREAVGRHVPADESAAAVMAIDAALARMPTLPAEPPTFLTSSNEDVARSYLAFLLKGDRRGAFDVVLRAMEGGLPLKRVYLDVFQQSQRELGRLWQLNRVTVAQEHYCTAATQAIMNQLFGRVLQSPRIGRKMIALCVAGDLHEIGLRIVTDLFEMAGWDCDFLGANMPAETILDDLPTMRPDLIAISATMAYHVELVEEFIGKLRERSEIRHIPVLVGGRPFFVVENLWKRVGADGWARDAETAVEEGTKLVQSR